MGMTNPQVTGAYAIISPGFGDIQLDFGMAQSPIIWSDHLPKYMLAATHNLAICSNT